jgi:hypothetical protein
MIIAGFSHYVYRKQADSRGIAQRPRHSVSLRRALDGLHSSPPFLVHVEMSSWIDLCIKTSALRHESRVMYENQTRDLARQ